MGRPLTPSGSHVAGAPVGDATFHERRCRCAGCCADHEAAHDAERRGVDPDYLPRVAASVQLAADPSIGWAAAANCQGQPIETFYPDTMGVGAIQVAEAKRVCASCEVVGQCLARALATPEYDDWGVWGGTTRNERMAMRQAIA